MRRILVPLVPALVAGTLSILTATPAAAAEAHGCAGSAVSTDADGNPYDQVEAPGAGGTKSDPFDVLYDGNVQWEGHTTDVIGPGTWKVTMWPGALLKLDDTFENKKGNKANQGDEVVSDRLPVKVTGLFKVDVEITGEGGTCTGSVWVRIADSPLFTPLWILGAALTPLGLLALLLAFPRARPVPGGGPAAGGVELTVKRHPLRGALGGLSLGLGLALMAIVYGKVAFGTKTPFVIVAGTIVVATALMFLPRRMPRPSAQDLTAMVTPRIIDTEGDTGDAGGSTPASDTPPETPPETAD